MTMLCKKMDKADLNSWLEYAPARFVAEIKEDGDRIRMRVKDKKITLYVDDAETVGLDVIREATVVHPTPSGLEYLIDVFAELGLGLTNRYEIGLVLK